MAIGAGGFALGNGVARRQVQLGANAGVAIQAYPLGMARIQGQVRWLVRVMAAIAAEVFLLVVAAGPQ